MFRHIIISCNHHLHSLCELSNIPNILDLHHIGHLHRCIHIDVFINVNKYCETFQEKDSYKTC